MSRPTPIVPDAVAHLVPFARAGVLGAVDVAAAAMLDRRAEARPAPEVLLAAALAVRALRSGHTCIDPTTVPTTITVDDTELAPTSELPWPEPDCWTETLETSGLVASTDPDAGSVGTSPPLERGYPLVWDGTRLYLRRYWDWEQAVASQLTSRASRRHDDRGDRSAVLDRLFPPMPGGRADGQRRAAETALARGLTVIAGGPGTGKTRTIARLLAAVYELSGSECRVALAAPTGKAAARMSEAVRGELDGLDVSPATAEALARVEASTIHRLLGATPAGTTRHDARDPLPHELVVVDEMSMVSLPLMARLLDATRPDTPLVLVGDPDQLTSVEAGTVLGDIVAGATADGGPLGACTVVLDRAHRFDAESPIATFAAAVRAGDTGTALDLLRGPGPLGRVDPDDDTQRRAIVASAAEDGLAMIDAAVRHDGASALAVLGRRRVLCANRRGPAGVAGWTSEIETAITAGGAATARRWYPGRPVLVVQNDHRTMRRNGDVGVAVASDPGGVGGDAGLVVVFDDGAVLAPARLDAIETLRAMTIHKSQGSEFDEVIVVLPEPPSPILTRELLYTAATRARRTVTIVASEEAIRACIDRPIARSTGLEIALARR